jgi:hypothetical protein
MSTFFGTKFMITEHFSERKNQNQHFQERKVDFHLKQGDMIAAVDESGKVR